MQFFSDFAPRYRVQEDRYFTATNTATSSATTAPTGYSGVWKKQPWARHFSLIFVGASGGGGPGATGAAGAVRQGGGGSGSAIGFCMNGQIWMLPDIILVCLGKGGLGGLGASATNGATGAYSGLAVPQIGNNLTTGWLEVINGSAGGVAGSTIAGAGGNAATLSAFNNLRGAFPNQTWAATVGSNGGTTASGGTHTTGSPLWSGSGGAGITAGNTASPGAQPLPSSHPYPPQTWPQGGATQGGAGEQQRIQFDDGSMMIFGMPGSGAGNNAGTGGKGGDAQFGAGASGGGAGTSGTGGVGGDGGHGADALCIFQQW